MAANQDLRRQAGEESASLVHYAFDNIVDALRSAAKNTAEGIVAYASGEASTTNRLSQFQRHSYAELLLQAEADARNLVTQNIVKSATPVIVHFDNVLDTCRWYWAVLLTGAIPVVTSPAMFSPTPSDRAKHLAHLHATFNSPLCITREALLGPFREQIGDRCIQTLAVETLDVKTNETAKEIPVFHPRPEDVAALMLTSGTSGQSKAVPITHQQMLAAFRGKSYAAALRQPTSPFLSWVNMDHVANLVHCHIFAIASSVSQIQVPAAEIVADPMQLLNLVSRYRVSRTFAPHFLLAKLRRQLEAGKTASLDPDLDLSTLYLDTGGEVNVIEVCVALQELLRPYKVTEDMFKPSFGMTETCAGCIFNNKCPSYDQATRSEFASLGTCMPGVQMRIAALDDSGLKAAAGQRGHLELTGEAVFAGYYNNPAATDAAFTADGWFRTGDLAYLDAAGHLHLDGRTKEMININGLKYLPHELDSALEQAEIPGVTPSYVCCFGHRDLNADTEVVVILYLPRFEDGNDAERWETQSAIVRVSSMHTRSRPIVVPLQQIDMPKSTLGKLSRTKLKAAFEAGEFTALRAMNDAAVKRHRRTTSGTVETPEEATILDVIRHQLEISLDDDFAVNDSLLSTGATSMDLVAIMHHLNKQLQLTKPVRLTDILNYPSARALAKRVGILNGNSNCKHEYDPVVVLQPHGHRTPLWLVHPGVGEVLVFVNLAHHITDRPVYAFRAKGFNASEGEVPFRSLKELFETYHGAIKKRQPHGPYAIAGYSFGGMVAFEIAKMLEAKGDEVRYCGSWNLPPHIKWRMRELLWDECVIHLFYFVGLLDEAAAYTHKPALCAFEREHRRLDAIRYLRQHCDAARWDELGLSEEYYLLWVGLASNMQGMAVDYEPTGSVKCMDVFVADPLSHVAKNREDWIQNRLAAWNDFVREEVRFHHVQGAHYTMLNADYVLTFADTLHNVLRQRGL